MSLAGGEQETGVGERVCYVNGGLVPESEARISIFDHAVLYGDGVFDTVIAWDGRLFRLDDHIDRLFRSMAAIAIAPPFSREELKALTIQTLRANKLESAYVKWVVTRGSNETPLMDPAGCEPNLIILEGITRATVLEIAEQRGVPLRVCDIELYHAYAADEAFLTSTAGGLVPVAEIDGRVIGDGRPGPIFTSFSKAYQAAIASPDQGVSIHDDQED